MKRIEVRYIGYGRTKRCSRGGRKGKKKEYRYRRPEKVRIADQAGTA
jgi:hypothetical protein